MASMPSLVQVRNLSVRFTSGENVSGPIMIWN